MVKEVEDLHLVIEEDEADLVGQDLVVEIELQLVQDVLVLTTDLMIVEEHQEDDMDQIEVQADHTQVVMVVLQEGMLDHDVLVLTTDLMIVVVERFLIAHLAVMIADHQDHHLVVETEVQADHIQVVMVDLAHLAVMIDIVIVMIEKQQLVKVTMVPLLKSKLIRCLCQERSITSTLATNFCGTKIIKEKPSMMLRVFWLFIDFILVIYCRYLSI
jgi:hypothetical protein